MNNFNINFPNENNKINIYNDFLLSEWNKVSNNKNKNKIHQNELTKKILFIQTSSV